MTTSALVSDAGVSRAPSLLERLQRPRWVACFLYLLVVSVLYFTAGPERLRTHTPYNHFALLAESWLHGRLDLGGSPPAYAGNNDFAVWNGKTFVSFPPFPAVLLVPFVWLAGSAEATRDGLVFVAVAALGPTFLFLALQKLSDRGRSRRALWENAALSLVFAFGTVFWFTAVQGTVWFAAHVVAVPCISLYLYASIDAEKPLLAGIALGLGIATRTPLFFALPLFVCELVRASRRGPITAPYFGLDPKKLGTRALLSAGPLLIILGLLAWHNDARFGNPLEFGHRYLTIVWRGRIEKWGLFSLHYLGKNLGVMLTSLPFVGARGEPFRINAHGLALTITSPFFAWALWPRRTARADVRFSLRVLAIVALSVALVDLLYQNSGWIQFGYRFSNDFSVFLIAMIALSRRRLGWGFWSLVAWSVMVNAYGAVTFQRAGYEAHYFVERSQTVVYEPD